MMRFLLLIVSAPLIAVPGCAPSAAAPTAPPPPMEVAVSVPLQQEVRDSLEYTGTTEAMETVDVRPRVTGFLTEMHFKLRSTVKAGDVLFSIDDQPFKNALDSAKANLLALEAKLQLAEFDQRKVKELFEKNNASDQEMVKAQSTLDAVRADIAAAQAALQQAELNYGWCKVTAPIAGRISRNYISVGNIVSADQTVLATITNDEFVYAYFNPSERDMLMYRERRTRELEKQGKTFDPRTAGDTVARLALMTDEGFPHEGVIDYVAPKLDESTGTLSVRAKFPSPSGVLVPGVFVRVQIPFGDPYQALLVTERALGSDQGQRYLLVVNDRNVVEQRFVKVGTLREGLRVIDEGIQAGDRVIVSGLQRVRPGVTVKPNDVPMPVGPAVRPREATTGTPPASRPASP